VARSSGATYIEPEHVFFALVLGQDARRPILARAGVTAEALTQGLREPAGGSGPRPEAADRIRDADARPVRPRPHRTRSCRRARPGDRTRLEIEQTIEILSRRTKNNPVLIGEAGVGKTAIVEGSRGDRRRRRARAARGRRVVALDLPAMLAGTRYRGDFEERLTQTMDEIAAHRARSSSSSTRCTPSSARRIRRAAAWTPATSSSRASRGATCTWSARPRSSTAGSRRIPPSSAASSP
jgi:ATP-dependent Clp protease ATP-binding subunit ClpC